MSETLPHPRAASVQTMAWVGRHWAIICYQPGQWKETIQPTYTISRCFFLASARDIVGAVKHISDEIKTEESEMKVDGDILGADANEHESKVEAEKNHDEVSYNELSGGKVDCRKTNSSSLLDQLSLKQRNGLKCLVSSLVPITSAIYGPVAVSELVFRMHILLIIDDAEELQKNELEFLRQVFRDTSEVSATIILMTDPYGFRYITETWAGMAMSKLDLLGLGRADIVAVAEFYLEDKETENSLRFDCSSLRSQTHSDINKQILGKGHIRTNTTEDYSLVQNTPETSNGNTETDENLILSTLEAEHMASEVKLTTMDVNSEKSKETTSLITEQKTDHKCKSDSKDSEDVTNPATFLDLMTGKKPVRKKNMNKNDDGYCRPKKIGDFLCRNICRLEKVLRFPEILIQTCDMFMDSLEVFDEITTSTDLIWTLIHWEGFRAISFFDSDESSQKGTDNDTECVKPLERCCTSSSENSFDVKSSEHISNSSESSSKLSEPVKEFTESTHKKFRDMDKTFYEKMYSWLLFIGEKSLVTFVNNEKIKTDDFRKLRIQTTEIFGDKVAEIMMNLFFKYSDFFGFARLPENVEEFVADHLNWNHDSDTLTRTITCDGEDEILNDPTILANTDEFAITLSDESFSSRNSFENKKSLPSQDTNTTTNVAKESEVDVTTVKKSENYTEQNNDDTETLLRFNLQAQAHLETPNDTSLHCGESVDNCPSDEQVKVDTVDLKFIQSQCLHPYETKSENDIYDTSKNINVKDDTFETSEYFNTSHDDFWGEILGSGSDKKQNEQKIYVDESLLSSSKDTIILQNICNTSEQTKIIIQENDKNTKEYTGQRENYSGIHEGDIINSKYTTDPEHETIVSEGSLVKNVSNGDLPEDSEHKLQEENIQPFNKVGVVNLSQDKENHSGNEENCLGKLDNHSSKKNSSDCDEISNIPVNTQIPNRQYSSDEHSEKCPQLILGRTTDDCLEENHSQEVYPARSVLGNSDNHTNSEELLNRQAAQNELRDGNDTNEETNNQLQIIHYEVTEQQVNNNVTDYEPVLSHTEHQGNQQINENLESQEMQHTYHNDRLIPHETPEFHQQHPMNDFMGGSVKVEEQKITNLEGNVTKTQDTNCPVTCLNSENERTNKKKHRQQRVSQIMQVLRDQSVSSPTPTLSIRNSVTSQFLASWFLVHEIQSGRSLASLTHGSRCCLRQLCIFSAGLVNRIRKLVGYNSELNRRRIVCALINHRSDSSDDLLFNMDLVAEFKAYPDLLSFVVEASEYPDEWHVSLYEAQLVPLQALLLNVAPSRIFLNIEEVRPFSEARCILDFLPRVEILVWLDSGRQFTYDNTERMDKIADSFTADVVLAKVELVAGCLTHNALVNLPTHDTFKSLVYLKLRVTDICSLSSLLSIDRQLKALLWLEVKLDFDWLSEEEGQINSLPRSSVPLFDVYLRNCVDEHVVHVSNLLAHMHQRYSGIHLESTTLTPESVYVLLKQLQQKDIRLYSHPTSRQRFRRWYYPQLADGPAPTDDLARERLGFDDRVFYSNHRVESSTYATAIDAWNLTSFLEEEDRIIHFVYTTENLNFVKRLTGCVEVEKTSK